MSLATMGNYQIGVFIPSKYKWYEVGYKITEASEADGEVNRESFHPVRKKDGPVTVSCSDPQPKDTNRICQPDPGPNSVIWENLPQIDSPVTITLQLKAGYNNNASTNELVDRCLVRIIVSP